MTLDFLTEVQDTISRLSVKEIDNVISVLENLKGRLFIIGSGGGAGNASHAVCDFRKLCLIDAITNENIPEITARTNDEGWETTITAWMAVSGFNKSDILFVLSVGGGNEKVSVNIHSAVIYAKNVGAKVVGIIGRKDGTTYKLGDSIVLVETSYSTPIVEGLQSVILHLIVTKLQKQRPVW